MKHNRKTFAGRVLASVGAAALGLAGIAGVASADVVGLPAPGQDGAKTAGSLSIFKRDGSAETAGDGTAMANPPGKPLGGAEFTIWQLGTSDGTACTALDLSDPADWEKVPTGAAPNDLDGVKDAGFCVVSGSEDSKKTADGTGLAKFEDLGLGLYYVQETGLPKGVTVPSAPFYVTIPLPHSDGTFIYDVNAYPKNQTTEQPTKEINTDATQDGLKVGDTVEYTITQVVPALPNATDKYTEAKVWDKLPTDLEFDKTQSVLLNGNELAGTDYTVTTSNPYSWSLGQDVLDALKPGDTIKVTFTAKVMSVGGANGIQNPPSTDPDENGYGGQFNGKPTYVPPTDPNEPDPEGPPTPTTYWGQLEITKVDAADATNTLANAEFAVHSKDATDTCPDTPVADTLVSTGVSGADGIVLWGAAPGASPLGLFVHNSQNPETDVPTRDYCVYETKAPAGYTPTTGATTVTITAGSTNILKKPIENTQKQGPDLPLTGASGTMLMVIAGVALVAIAGGASLVVRRRADQQ